jgi:hypothetical protein
MSAGAGAPLTVRIEPWGPNAAALDAAAGTALGSARVRRLLDGRRSRVISQALVGPDLDPRRRPAQPRDFRAAVYDYDEDRLLQVEGRLDRPREASVRELAAQPLPSGEEFAAAVGVIRDDPELGPPLRDGRLVPYRPMPPLVPAERPDGVPERVVAVGLRPAGHEPAHEIVGVSLSREAVLRQDGGAPPAARALAAICGPADAGQPTTARGTPGSARITVSRGGTTLWRMIVLRPAASSGTNGSGVELRMVDYRGRRVLRRAHVPILNVRYDGDACGPYRDWQWQEGQFHAVGTDQAPGFRLCTAPATTLLEGGDDVGTFAGVAVWTEGEECVLVSELEAGWYRYISQWRLHADGTIRPRFGFAAVQSSCVCNVHHHHAYWRLNFDIGSAAHNRLEEWNDPPGPRAGAWRTQRFEARRPRADDWGRKWRVTDVGSGRGYEIVPGAEDGAADTAFGLGDLWVVRLRPNQIDDGQGFTTDPALARAHIDRFVNGERVDDGDIVVWYAGHFSHDIQHDTGPEHGHIVGPDLRPVSWA